MSSHLTGLSKAFGNTSDPRYLFQSQSHANALSLLAGGTEESRNIRVLIGEPGMGKTVLLLHLLGRFQHSAFLDPARTRRIPALFSSRTESFTAAGGHRTSAKTIDQSVGTGILAGPRSGCGDR